MLSTYLGNFCYMSVTIIWCFYALHLSPRLLKETFLRSPSRDDLSFFLGKLLCFWPAGQISDQNSYEAKQITLHVRHLTYCVLPWWWCNHHDVSARAAHTLRTTGSCSQTIMGSYQRDISLSFPFILVHETCLRRFAGKRMKLHTLFYTTIWKKT